MGIVHSDDPLAALSESLSTPREVELELEREAMAEFFLRGRISYMGARRRRSVREQAIASAHTEKLGA